MLIDTHAHLDDKRLLPGIQELATACKSAGVERVYIPNCDEDSLADILQACLLEPGWAVPMVGIHPTYLKDGQADKQAAWVEEQLHTQASGTFAAVGEVGLDLYWRQDNLEEQTHLFSAQIQIAERYGLPLVIHSRNAMVECLRVVGSIASAMSCRGIFHCFSGSVQEAEAIIRSGFMLGIGGNVTYPKNETLETLRTIGLTNVVLETDSPYLAPVPHRGKTNSPLYVPVIAAFLSDKLGISYKEVCEITTASAMRAYQPRSGKPG